MDEALPEEFWTGIEQFNQGQYYTCHDTLEAVWIEAPTADKNFYQGILQIGVGLYHLGNQNWRGAVILIGEGLHRLRKYPSDHGGVDLGRFVEDSAELLSQIQAIGGDRVAQITFNPPTQPDQIFLPSPIIQKVASPD